MKKLVLVDDCPWKAKDSLFKFIEQGIQLEDTFIFIKREGWDKDNQTLIKELEKAVCKHIREVSLTDFAQKMDEYYRRDNIVLLFDLNLEDGKDDIEQRINVQYAQSKNMKDNKIFFYTNAGKDQKALLHSYFPNNVIDIVRFDEGQLELDMEKIKKVLSEK